jgi:hypothetical protein
MKTLLELFDSGDKKKRLSHVKNLVVVALADGSIEKRELEMIFQIGIRAGLKPEELKRIIERPDSVEFFPPSTFRERIEQLYDMVLVMLINGEIDTNEVLFCKAVAIKIGFKPAIIDKMVQDIIDAIVKGLAFDLIFGNLKQYA